MQQKRDGITVVSDAVLWVACFRIVENSAAVRAATGERTFGLGQT